MRPTMKVVSVALVPLFAAAAVGCGSDSSSNATATSSSVEHATANELPITGVVDERGKAEVTIEMKDNTFNPKVVRVDPGTKVIWTNKGANSHNVVPNKDGQFPRLPADESKNIEPGSSESYTFADAGTFRYYCKIHGVPGSGQRGAIVVGEG